MTKESLWAIALVCAGIYVIVKAFIQYVSDKRALAWPTTTGRIISSEVEGKWETSNGDSTYMYSPRIEYTYEVSGVQYTGDRFRQVEISTTGPGNAESVVSQFPVGSEVEVYYRPSNPSKSMLGRAAFTPGILILLLMLGGGLLAGGVVWLTHL